MKRMKERDREAEKGPQPDKLEVICPLIFKLAHLAVNYDLTWQPETKITVEDDEGFTSTDVTGVWKSNPVQRGHTDAFQQELRRMREAGDISWNESAYYFTHEEGVEARKAYERMVLDGELKAHITSWGPNPKKANDKSRFHRFTGVPFDELQEKYPDLYKRASAKPVDRQEAEEKEEVTTTKEEEPVIAEAEQAEPTPEDLKDIQEEQRVAAATATEDTVDSLVLSDTEEDADDHSVIDLYVSPAMQEECVEVNGDSIKWRSVDGQEMQAFLMELPELDTEMWLSIGKHKINNQIYDIRLED